MRKRAFGPAETQVPIIGFGTWNIEKADRRAAISAIHKALDTGATHIDTAEMYGGGKAEEITAEAIAGRRDGVFLVSKVLPSNATRQGVLRACEASLRRLRTDRLDCYLLHWRGGVPLAETIGAFEQLRAEGKIASWGVSNFDRGDIEEALAIAGEGRIACNQVLYHLEERAIEHEVVPACREHGIAMVAYSPLGQGRLPRADRGGGRVLAEIARTREATLAQIALAFLTRGEGSFAIPKSASAERVAENAGAGDLVLTDAEIAAIDRAFPRGRKPRSLPTA